MNKEIHQIIMAGIGSHGLNLQCANEVVYSSVSFDWERMAQSRGRISRLGQTSRELEYTYILTKSPIVEMIQNNLDKKDKLVDSLAGEIKSHLEKEFENERLRSSSK